MSLLPTHPDSRCTYVNLFDLEGTLPVTNSAGERFSVRVLVSRKLHRGLEGFGAEGALVRAHVRVRQQVVVEHTVRFEPAEWVICYTHNM